MQSPHNPLPLCITLGLITCLISVLARQSIAQELIPSTPTDEQITVQRFTYNAHPRLFVKIDRLREVKRLIEQGVQPYADAFKNLIKTTDTYLDDEPKPFKGSDVGGFFPASMGDSDDGDVNKAGDAPKARDLALAFHLSGDRKYVKKAKYFLMKWASQLPMPGTEIISAPGKCHPAVGMVIARGIIPFCYAYDLVCNEMAPTERHQVEKWFLALAGQIKNGAKNWDLMKYYGHQDFQNHLVAHTAGLAVIGYVTGDVALVQFAMDHPENKRDASELLTGLFFMAGDTPHRRETTQVLPQQGEIYDRYRHDTAKGRGLQYCFLSMQLFTVLAEVAWNNGIDLYNLTAKTGERLESSFEFYSPFIRLKNLSQNGDYYRLGHDETSAIGRSGITSGIFELPVARELACPECKLLLQSIDRTSNIHMSPYLGRTVLTHGIILQK